MPSEASSRRALIGRGAMTLGIAIYAFVPLVVDLGSTHALHPQWPPHARMHLVWLVVTSCAVGLVALRFVWRTPWSRASASLAGLLSLCVLGGFFLSAATHPLYAGALHDPGGVPPVGPVDANLLAFTVALALVAVGWSLAPRTPAEGGRIRRFHS